jgi:hypothetical protein
MRASSGAKHPTALCLWLGLMAMSACVGGHVAHAADLTVLSDAAARRRHRFRGCSVTGMAREPDC